MPAVRVAVVGSGTMGVGVAYVFAGAGADVEVVDARPELAEAGVEKVRALFSASVERGKATAAEAEAGAARVAPVGGIDAVADAPDLLVEAVPEDRELKREVLARAEGRHPGVLATNTSAISIEALAEALERPERFCGMHFFNPVWANPLVEVVVGPRTAPATVDQVLAAVAAIAKEPVVVRDAPGFATSRLGVALGLEAMRMLEDGVAEAADIDRAMELGYRHPMGPLRLTDLVGLDVRLSIAENLAQAYGPRFEPPAILRQLVAEGRLGKKTGAGFYDWG